MADLSIVFGTYNRFAHLRSLIESIEANVERDYEIVVADGGSTDGSREWLVTLPHVVMIGERTLHGAVDAYNKAFSLCRAPLVAHLNDDCLLMSPCLDRACDLLESDDSIGQVALPFYDGDLAVPPQLNSINWKGTKVLYANFGVLRRKVGDALGWWGDYLHTYGGDCELSFNIWNSGLKVVPLRGYALRHYREQDELRRENTESRKFFTKWATWTPPKGIDDEYPPTIRRK